MPTVKHILIALSSPDPRIRQGSSAKAGPVVIDDDIKDRVKGDEAENIREVHQPGRRIK
jgi:ribose 5-phosphate isomerase A